MKRIMEAIGGNSKEEIIRINFVGTEIVRCKNCKYRYGDKDEPYCDRINPYMRMRVEDDDFCSWGEKNG